MRSGRSILTAAVGKCGQAVGREWATVFCCPPLSMACPHGVREANMSIASASCCVSKTVYARAKGLAMIMGDAIAARGHQEGGVFHHGQRL